VAKDAKRAVELYTEAAAAGHAGAKSNLGYCFQSGLGVAKDAKRAVELYAEAAAAGDEVAMGVSGRLGRYRMRWSGL